MRIALTTGMMILCFMMGHLFSQVKQMQKTLVCSDFNTKHSLWKGYMAVDVHEDVRCFWVEAEYPNRVRQGIPVNQ
jgi:hypothetical protein